MFPDVSKYSFGLISKHQSLCWMTVLGILAREVAKLFVFCSCLINGWYCGTRTREMQLNKSFVHMHT